MRKKVAVMAETKKKTSIIKKLKTEYKLLDKPNAKELAVRTSQILGCAIAGALVIRGVDTVFSSILMLIF